MLVNRREFGTLAAGGRVLNVTTGKSERIGRLLMMHANDREELDQVYAGAQWKTVSIERGPRLASDHYPVIVVLRRPISAAPPGP